DVSGVPGTLTIAQSHVGVVAALQLPPVASWKMVDVDTSVPAERLSLVSVTIDPTPWHAVDPAGTLLQLLPIMNCAWTVAPSSIAAASLLIASVAVRVVGQAQRARLK